MSNYIILDGDIYDCDDYFDKINNDNNYLYEIIFYCSVIATLAYACAIFTC